jgi:hypothetical protein
VGKDDRGWRRIHHNHVAGARLEIPGLLLPVAIGSVMTLFPSHSESHMGRSEIHAPVRPSPTHTVGTVDIATSPHCRGHPPGREPGEILRCGR